MTGYRVATQPAQAWLPDALCAQVGPDLFHGDDDGAGGAVTMAYRQAKQVCQLCPVRNECLEWALGIESKEAYSFGVFGGLLPAERRRIINGAKPAGYELPRLRRDPLPCGTTAAARRHQRRGEAVCESCKEAVRREKNDRRAA